MECYSDEYSSAEYHFAECHSAESVILLTFDVISIIKLHVILQSVILMTEEVLKVIL